MTTFNKEGKIAEAGNNNLPEIKLP
jgi:hypothetical protein